MPLKINGSTSGSVTLAAPATGSDVTLTLPSAAGTVQTVPGAWTAYTPTVAGYTGSIGTVTVNSAAYQSFGKQVAVRVDVTFAPGTAASGVTMTLPITAVAARRGTVSGVETQVTGWTLGGFNDTDSRMFITKYDGTAPWSGTGNNRIVATFIYEAA